MDNSKKFNAYRSNFGGRGWFLVIFSLITHYLVTASVNTMNVTAGVFSGQHGWSTTTLYSFQTIAGWVAVFTMFLSGYLAQKYSPKLVSLISLIFFAAALSRAVPSEEPSIAAITRTLQPELIMFST